MTRMLLLSPLDDTFGKSKRALTSLIKGNVSFHRKDDGRHIDTTFLLDGSVLDL
jgi:hypothetical protein